MTFSGTAQFQSNLQVQTSGSTLALLLSNATTANITTANSSQTLQFAADYYNGSSSAIDYWNIQSSLVAGANGASTLNVTHTGSTGQASINLASSLELSWNADAGISRLGAASLAIGNGTAGDFTGALELTTLTFADSTSMTTAMTFGRVIATALGMNMN
jgi:hypothetical protein